MQRVSPATCAVASLPVTVFRSLARVAPSRHACRNPDREVVARWRLGCVVESFGPAWPPRFSSSPAGRSSTSAPCRSKKLGQSRSSTHQERLFAEGKQIFRFDTFGDEDWWGGQLQLHKAIAGEENGGVGPGVSPKTALAVGLKVDAEALPKALVNALKKGQVDLDDPKTTLALLKLNSVLGVKGFFNRRGTLRSVGITCALCHSTVDDSLAPGIGKRLDGWASRGSERRSDRLARPQPEADHRRARRRRGDAQEGAAELGARLLRRRGQHRRQGLPSGRQVGRDPHPGRIRSSRREPPHLDGRLRERDLLERLCRQPPDARQRQLQRLAAERPGQVPGGNARQASSGSATSRTW